MENIAIGQVGVYRIAAELLRRELTPFLPAVDTGVDVSVNGSLKIQVKSTIRSVNNKWGRPYFQFTLKTAARYLRTRAIASKTRRFSDQCDFVVCHAIDENRSWVFPAHVLDHRAALLIHAEGRPQWKNLDLARIQSLRSQGLTLQAIADQVGSSFETVRQRLAHRKEPKREYIRSEQYENRWDLITSALSFLREANSAAQPNTADSVDGKHAARV